MEDRLRTRSKSSDKITEDPAAVLELDRAEENRAHLSRIRQQIAAALGPMTRHEDYICKQLRQR
jgi:hypothetical protein